jgi:hypothetical protein
MEVLAQPYATCHFNPGKDSAIPMEGEWALELVWIFWTTGKSLVLHRIQTSNHIASSLVTIMTVPSWIIF